MKAPDVNDTDCIFCRIVAGDIPSTRVVETESVIAFRDIAPKAPTHIVIIPRQHLSDVADVAAAAPDVLAEMVEVAQRIADEECSGQFKLIFNTGPNAGQTVFHAHAHVIGGAGWGPV
jgi:histidine triad (HIT) family protein